MKITLDFRKTVEENAAEYFEKAKKAKKKLGYNPQTDIKEGIKKFVEWYKKYNPI